MEITHELFGCFAFYVSLVLGKVLIMAFWTAKRRFANNTFANPEDAKGPGAKCQFGVEEVERVRRCHQVKNPFFKREFDAKNLYF